MEIIAKIENGHIVKIMNTELEKLTGFYYNRRQPPFKIGDEVMVDALYDQLCKLSSNEGEIKKMAHSLRSAAGILEKIDPIFREPEER